MVPGLEDSRPIDLATDPLGLLARWPRDVPALLLHSGRHHPRWATYSLLASPAGAYQFVASPQSHGDAVAPQHHPTGISRWLGPPGIVPATSFTHQPFHDLRLLLTATAGKGVWLGYLSYDLGRWVERLPQHATADRDWPVIELAWCPGWLIHTTGDGQWHECGTWHHGPPLSLLPGSPAVAGSHATASPRSVFTRPTYERAVQRVIDYIAAGDAFQVNLAQRFTAELAGQHPTVARSLFSRLATSSPAWYGAHLELPDRRAVCSTSPELFLQVTPDGRVVTRPIKGTRPTSDDPRVLRDSPKDTAELNMIVDLLRNDLGRVCDYGSMRVDNPREIESHPTVHHGVATISGRLHRSKDLVDLLRATIPGGSVTGAPKVRAMEIIDELEPVRRGPYCGAIGWLTHDAACLSIAIRTMLVEPAPQAMYAATGSAAGSSWRVDYSVGGGIVADSQPTSEYEETLHKAAAMVRALAPAAQTPQAADPVAGPARANP